MKPMKACNWDENKIRFPIMAQPKLDGVRGLTTEGKLTGRSLKPFANLYTQAKFSTAEYSSLDFEMACGKPTDSDLCRKTTSALSTITGTPLIHIYVFDYLNTHTKVLPYAVRHMMLGHHIRALQNMYLATDVHVIKPHMCENMSQLLRLEDKWLADGYEGVILRDPNGKHKEGRSTVNERGFMRIKRFEDAEAIVTAIVEGEHNNNEAQTNELGRTFRTSHQENKIPNGMVGSLTCITPDKQIITVAPGAMTHQERQFYFENQHKLIGQTIKYKHFPKGVKDKPRFPTFLSIRSTIDMD